MPRAPLAPPVVPPADLDAHLLLAWAARLRAASGEAAAQARRLPRRGEDAGLSGPAGDALAALTARVAGDLLAAAGAAGAAAQAVLAAAAAVRAAGPTTGR